MITPMGPEMTEEVPVRVILNWQIFEIVVTLDIFFPAWHSVLLLLVAYGAQVSHERRGFYLLSPAEKKRKGEFQTGSKKSVMEVVGFNFQQKQVSLYFW